MRGAVQADKACGWGGRIMRERQRAGGQPSQRRTPAHQAAAAIRACEAGMRGPAAPRRGRVCPCLPPARPPRSAGAPPLRPQWWTASSTPRSTSGSRWRVAWPPWASPTTRRCLQQGLAAVAACLLAAAAGCALFLPPATHPDPSCTRLPQGELGDIVYAEMPEVGASFSAGDRMAIVESVKVGAGAAWAACLTWGGVWVVGGGVWTAPCIAAQAAAAVARRVRQAAPARRRCAPADACAPLPLPPALPGRQRHLLPCVGRDCGGQQRPGQRLGQGGCGWVWGG